MSASIYHPATDAQKECLSALGWHEYTLVPPSCRCLMHTDDPEGAVIDTGALSWICGKENMHWSCHGSNARYALMRSGCDHFAGRTFDETKYALTGPHQQGSWLFPDGLDESTTCSATGRSILGFNLSAAEARAALREEEEDLYVKGPLREERMGLRSIGFTLPPTGSTFYARKSSDGGTAFLSNWDVAAGKAIGDCGRSSSVAPPWPTDGAKVGSATALHMVFKQLGDTLCLSNTLAWEHPLHWHRTLDAWDRSIRGIPAEQIIEDIAEFEKSSKGGPSSPDHEHANLQTFYRRLLGTDPSSSESVFDSIDQGMMKHRNFIGMHPPPGAAAVPRWWGDIVRAEAERD